MSKKPNKLINEKSPYLLQHAYNPVNWYSWSSEAFEKAKQEDKPIFLSIGYSTCHWCHVMEKESFEDQDVAALMNDAFISIKVDREERPDIDSIYMSACQMITGSGGWPLTVVLTPDKKPFFVGTYFPKQNRFNRIGMIELIPKLKEIWLTRRDEVNDSADEITLSLQRQSSVTSKTEIDESILDQAFNDLLARFDKEDGGFGNHPKFPSPHNLMFLLRYWKKRSEPKALEMVEKTLTQMRLGGIYDQIGFGFARYSIDSHWLVPHFEKMLYDQAMLVLIYTETYQVTKNDFYKRTAEEIIEYVLRDMTDQNGGFFSAEDADSEGEEGKFYLWTADEVRNVLTKEESTLALKVFNILESGNWVDESKGIKNGTNILHLTDTIEKVASDMNIDLEKLELSIESIRKKLFNHREKRIHPHKDDKILTDWNALMISALAKASQVFSNKIYSDAAERAYRFIEVNLVEIGGRLAHRYRDNEAGLPAHIDDYAFLINASIDLYETTFNVHYLKKAHQLNETFVNEFWDENNGGFFFTSSKNEELINRQKDVYDGAIPSGNSIALLNLVRLARFSDNLSLDKKAKLTLEYFSAYISKSPSAFCMFMCALDFMYSGSMEIVIVTKSINKTFNNAVQLIHKTFNPNKILILRLEDMAVEDLQLFPFIEKLKRINDADTFYICSNHVCHRPINSLSELEKSLI